MNLAEAVGGTLAEGGIDCVFGVAGSGNFHITNALVDAGARFVAARHENGAATMADAYARMSGRVSAVTVHQGCGLTNVMTGITEAAKSRTPMVVVAAEVTQPRSNFDVDRRRASPPPSTAEPARITSAATAVAETRAAIALARLAGAGPSRAQRPAAGADRAGAHGGMGRSPGRRPHGPGAAAAQRR